MFESISAQSKYLQKRVEFIYQEKDSPTFRVDGYFVAFGSDSSANAADDVAVAGAVVVAAAEASAAVGADTAVVG